MSRRTMAAIATAVLALAMALVTSPSYASADGSAKSLPPCPLTKEQFEAGKLIVADAVDTIDWVRVVYGDGPGRPFEEPKPEQVNWDSAELCLLALKDIKDKTDIAKVAARVLSTCAAWSVLDGRSCVAEELNLRSAVHDLEVAINNLTIRCPWLAI